MIILDYDKKKHKQIMHVCIAALKAGKIIAYPTDTSYGLAVDALNLEAIIKIYRLKGRNFNRPVHIVLPSLKSGKKIAKWNKHASLLCQKFWPGALTLVLELKAKGEGFRMLTAGNNTIGLRMPNNKIALDLAKELKSPITATSANISGKPDIYSASQIIKEFKKRKYKPDIVINAGKLPKKKPSTVLKVDAKSIEIIRQGPVSKSQIFAVLGK